MIVGTSDRFEIQRYGYSKFIGRAWLIISRILIIPRFPSINYLFCLRNERLICIHIKRVNKKEGGENGNSRELSLPL